MTNDFDLVDTRRRLDAMRVKHGADTPIGHRCSNLIEQIQSYRNTKDIETRRNLAKLIAGSVADLGVLAHNAEARAIIEDKGERQ